MTFFIKIFVQDKENSLFCANINKFITMKKLILSALLLAGMTFVACSSDDDNGGNCITCTFEGESEQVCKGDNGNAFVDGEDQGITFEEAVEICQNLANPNNPGEPSGECKTCTYQGESVEICKGDNGNAFVEGIDIGIAYSTAIQSLGCN